MTQRWSNFCGDMANGNKWGKVLPQCTERVWWGPESECRVVTRKYPAALQQTANISYTLHELLLHTFVSLYTSFVFCLAGIWNLESYLFWEMCCTSGFWLPASAAPPLAADSTATPANKKNTLEWRYRLKTFRHLDATSLKSDILILESVDM